MFNIFFSSNTSFCDCFFHDSANFQIVPLNGCDQNCVLNCTINCEKCGSKDSLLASKYVFNSNDIRTTFKPRLLRPTRFAKKSSYSITNTTQRLTTLTSRTTTTSKLITSTSTLIKTTTRFETDAYINRLPVVGLTNHWSMSSLFDSLTGISLAKFNTITFLEDRFGTKASSVCLSNYAYLQVTTSLHFGAEFTIFIWIKFNSFKQKNQIIDFGSSNLIGNAIMMIYDQKLHSCSLDTVWLPSYCMSHQLELALNTWYHFAWTVKNKKSVIYINGAQSVSSFLELTTSNRSENYIGKSYSDFLPNLEGCIDDIKISSVALTSEQVLNEYLATSNTSFKWYLFQYKTFQCKEHLNSYFFIIYIFKFFYYF